MSFLDKWSEISTKTKVIVSTAVLILSSGYGAYKFTAGIYDQLLTEAEASELQQSNLLMMYQIKLDGFNRELSFLSRQQNKTPDDLNRIQYLRDQILYYERLIECMQSGKNNCGG